MPRRVPLQIVSLSAESPAGDGWLHEVKHDGHRLLAIVVDGAVTLLSRNARDRTMTGENYRDGAYPEDRYQMMAAFDELPPELREAVANSIEQWAATPLLKRCQRSRDASKVLARFRSNERHRLEFFEYHRARALGAYAGNWAETDDGGQQISWPAWLRSAP